jgi:hypothetical protein
MLKLYMVQAAEGDCFVVAYGTPTQPRFMLVDGGPDGVYTEHLRPTLFRLDVERLDLVVLSHVCKDHVVGLLALLSELRDLHDAGADPILGVRRLWHNAFSRTMGDELNKRLARLISTAPNAAALVTGNEPVGVSEGSVLSGLAADIKLPLNPEFGGGLITVDDQLESQELDNLIITVVGPTLDNLAGLQGKWETWLDDNEETIAEGGIAPAAMSDSSKANLSSIQLLLEADGKSILFTGDGRGDHLLAGLAQWGLIDADDDSVYHVDVLKVSHHGSKNNSTRRFFEKVTADHYVISGDHSHQNPRFETLEWIVQAAAGRAVTLHLSNRTPNVDRLEATYPPDQHGYTVRVMRKNWHSMVLKLA